MNTRRFPRTMVEAFGPYTNNELHAPSERSHRWATRLYLVILVVSVIGLAFGMGVPS